MRSPISQKNNGWPKAATPLGSKYKGHLYINIEFKMSLYFGTEWYPYGRTPVCRKLRYGSLHGAANISGGVILNRGLSSAAPPTQNGF